MRLAKKTFKCHTTKCFDIERVQRFVTDNDKLLFFKLDIAVLGPFLDQRPEMSDVILEVNILQMGSYDDNTMFLKTKR